MCPQYDPIGRAIEIQLGGLFSKRPYNPESLINSAIDQKCSRRKTIKEKIILYILEGYTQAEIGLFLRMSQQHVGRLMRKIPVSDPYIVERGKQMDRIQTIQAELKTYRILQRKMKNHKPDPNPDPKAWRVISEGGYLKRSIPPSEEQFERD